jgi:hypothetical protein
MTQTLFNISGFDIMFISKKQSSEAAAKTDIVDDQNREKY